MSDWKQVFRNSTKLPNGDTLAVSLLGYQNGEKKLVRCIAQVSRKDGTEWSNIASTACDIIREGEHFKAQLPEKIEKEKGSYNSGTLF